VGTRIAKGGIAGKKRATTITKQETAALTDQCKLTHHNMQEWGKGLRKQHNSAGFIVKEGERKLKGSKPFRLQTIWEVFRPENVSNGRNYGKIISCEEFKCDHCPAGDKKESEGQNLGSNKGFKKQKKTQTPRPPKVPFKACPRQEPPSQIPRHLPYHPETGMATLPQVGKKSATLRSKPKNHAHPGAIRVFNKGLVGGRKKCCIPVFLTFPCPNSSGGWAL